MQEKQQKQEFIKETINLEQLKPSEEDTADPIDFEQIRQNPGEFEKSVIQAPENITFDKERHLKVIDGFTPEAKKNIIIISHQKLRVFAVKNDSITLLSFSDLSEEASQAIFDPEFGEDPDIIFHSYLNSLQVISSKEGNNCILFQLEPKSGKILKTKKLKFSQMSRPHQKRQLEALPKPKNSKIDSYVEIFDDQEHHQIALTGFLRLRRTRARKWLDLTRMIRKKHKIQQEIYLQQRGTADFPLDPDFPSIDSTKIFRSKSQPNAWICYISSSVIHTVLVNFKHRKVLRSKSINILNFLNSEKISEIAQGDENGEAGAGGDLNQEENQEEDEMFRFDFYDVFFEEETQTLILDMKWGRDEIFVKIQNLFVSNDLTDDASFSILMKKTPRSKNSLIGEFSTQRLLCLGEGIAGSPNRPLEFLNTQNLAKTKLKGYTESQWYSAMNDLSPNNKTTRTRLCEGRMLIVTFLSAFIYDFEEGRVVDHHQHTLHTLDESDLTSLSVVDGLFAMDYEERFYMVKTELDKDSGLRVVKTVNTIFYEDFVELEASNRSSPAFNLLRLRNGNFLMVKAFNLKLVGNSTAAEQMSVEIHADTLEVVKFNRRDLSDFTGSFLPGCSIYHVSGYLVFSAKLPTSGQNLPPGPECAFLTLARLDFEIVDRDQKAPLIGGSAIALISENKIISLGSDKSLYLHEVDTETEKLTL